MNSLISTTIKQKQLRMILPSIFKHLTSLLFMMIGITIHAQDATAILQKVDQNMSSTNRVFTSSMTIHSKRSSRTIQSKSYAVGSQKSMTEYLSPATEKGTKMLKLEGQIWIYSPSTDRIIQISGHMLRQSVMGSDLSYEDMMDDRQLSDIYNAKVIGREIIADRDTYIFDLTAKVTDVAYFSQKIWVDAERFVPLKQELFAKSGQLLKKMELQNVQMVQGRWFPMHITYKDMLKDGKGTEFEISEVSFNQTIPEHIFSKAALKK
jgi:outer membrane lipoprotein-sorting protein